MNNREDAGKTDQQYMIEFYESYKGYLLHAARKFTDSQSDCEDIVQDVLVRLMRNISTLRQLNKNQTATYLFLTVRSVYADRMKSAQQRAVPFSDASLEILNTDIANDLQDHMCNAKWDAEILKSTLPAKDWILLEEKYILGYSDNEIARTRNCSPDSIRTLLRRVRFRAKQILANKEREE